MDYISILLSQVLPILYKPYVMLIGVQIDDLLVVQYFAQDLICWRSKKQQVVAQSSTETEYESLAQVTKEILWF